MCILVTSALCMILVIQITTLSSSWNNEVIYRVLRHRRIVHRWIHRTVTHDKKYLLFGKNTNKKIINNRTKKSMLNVQSHTQWHIARWIFSNLKGSSSFSSLPSVWVRNEVERPTSRWPDTAYPEVWHRKCIPYKYAADSKSLTEYFTYLLGKCRNIISDSQKHKNLQVVSVLPLEIFCILCVEESKLLVRLRLYIIVCTTITMSHLLHC